MKTILSALMILALPLAAEESLDEGLFIPAADVPSKIEVSKGEIVYRQKAMRINPARIVFRYDLEDKEQYWLEMELPLLIDPGDFYFFMVDGQNYTGFVYRDTEHHPCKWALGFKDRKLGCELLRKIGDVYDLPEADVIDET